MTQDRFPAFTASMNQSYPGANPTAWELRKIYPENWIRLYYFSETKLQPNNMVERRSIYRIVHRLTSLLLNDNDEKYAAVPIVIGPDDEFYLSDRTPDQIGSDFSYYAAYDDDPDSDWKIQVYIKRSSKAEELLQSTLDRIIDENVMQSLFFSTAGNAIAPYAGGVDIFTKDVRTLDQIVTEFSGHLSSREDGL